MWTNCLRGKIKSHSVEGSVPCSAGFSPVSEHRHMSGRCMTLALLTMFFCIGMLVHFMGESVCRRPSGGFAPHPMPGRCHATHCDLQSDADKPIKLSDPPPCNSPAMGSPMGHAWWRHVYSFSGVQQMHPGRSPNCHSVVSTLLGVFTVLESFGLIACRSCRCVPRCGPASWTASRYAWTASWATLGYARTANGHATALGCWGDQESLRISVVFGPHR